jgi:hypothetical protein
MRNVILIIGIFLFITSCEKSEDDVKYPDCLQTYIDIFLENNPSPRSPRSTIKKYMYDDNEVFLIDFLPNVPDTGASVVSFDCNPICFLGGIDGSQNDCVNWENAQYVETIWTDNR